MATCSIDSLFNSSGWDKHLTIDKINKWIEITSNVRGRYMLWKKRTSVSMGCNFKYFVHKEDVIWAKENQELFKNQELSKKLFGWRRFQEDGTAVRTPEGHSIRGVVGGRERMARGQCGWNRIGWNQWRYCQRSHAETDLDYSRIWLFL